MNGFTDRGRPPRTQVEHQAQDHPTGHGSHHLLMMLGCIPMVAIVLVLVASGSATTATLLLPIACMVMMAFMMSNGHGR